MPITTLQGMLLGAVQFIVGPNSPALEYQSAFVKSDRIVFLQAAVWLVHQISSPLQYLLGYVNKPAVRPPSTASRISTPLHEGDKGKKGNTSSSDFKQDFATLFTATGPNKPPSSLIFSSSEYKNL